jgi:hypothetical protein
MLYDNSNIRRGSSLIAFDDEDDDDRGELVAGDSNSVTVPSSTGKSMHIGADHDVFGKRMQTARDATPLRTRAY